MDGKNIKRVRGEEKKEQEREEGKEVERTIPEWPTHSRDLMHREFPS